MTVSCRFCLANLYWLGMVDDEKRCNQSRQESLVSARIEGQLIVVSICRCDGCQADRMRGRSHAVALLSEGCAVLYGTVSSQGRGLFVFIFVSSSHFCRNQSNPVKLSCVESLSRLRDQQSSAQPTSWQADELLELSLESQ